ncbi:DUF2026 family protein [Paralcaligenes ginsengisoli]
MPKTAETQSQNPLTAQEYERIYQVIHAVLEDRANTPHACMFFAIAGSFILNKHHGIAARPVAGAFLLCVDPTPSVLSIGKNEGNTIGWDQNNFHMWVQTEHHIIDFIAPIFLESVQARLVVPRRMFQRRQESESPSIDDLSSPGDFYTFPDPDLSEHFINALMDRPNHVDLLLAIDAWYKPHPAPLAEMALLDNYGKVEPLRIVAPRVDGAW